MPPKTRPTKSQTARKNDKDVSSDKQQSTCDGCLDVVAENDALKCSSCSVWLHCYCAGIPRSHFERIASFFTCSACSLTASRTVVTELKSEISALKQEIQELKAALIQEKHASQSMAKNLMSSAAPRLSMVMHQLKEVMQPVWEESLEKLAVCHEESRSKSNEHLPQRLLEVALDRRERWRFETATPRQRPTHSGNQ